MQEHLTSHEPELYLELSVFDKNGVRVKHIKKRAESLLWNWLEILRGVVSGTSPVVKDVTGASLILNTLGTRLFYMNNPGWVDSTSAYGIVVGTGITPVTLLDYKLATQIIHGTGAGQLAHKAGFLHQTSTVQAVSMLNPTLVSNLQLGRFFVNNSSATITVKEVGIYVTNEVAQSPTQYTCIVRDLLLENIGCMQDPWRPTPDPGTCDIGPNQSLLVTYMQTLSV